MEYGSEFHRGANAPWLREADTGFVRADWRLMRSGRDALKALAKLAGRKRVLLPALCCESMLVPFQLAGYELVFYRLTQALCADEADVAEKLRDGDLLLTMPYFGIRPFRDAFLQSLRESGRGILIAEDRTQDIIVPREDRFLPDVTLASLRKWAAMPEGGMLCTALRVDPGTPEPRFAALRTEAMEKKDRYLTCWDAALKQDFLSELHKAEALLDEGAEPHGMDGANAAYLRRLDFAAIYDARVRNLRCLTALLAPLERAGKLRFLTAAPEKSGLYLPLLLDERDKVQKAMAARDVYCPVIWPEPPEVAGVCPVSRHVVGHILCLPCDQRYGAEEMDFIIRAVRDCLNP